MLNSMQKSRRGEWEMGRRADTRIRCVSPRLPLSLSPPLHCLLLAVALFTTGCPQEASQPTPAPPGPSVTLRVLVVNDPALVESLNRLRGEWAERSRGELTASAATWKDLSAAQTLDADVVIFPSRYLGEFAARDWLRPVRSSVLESADLKLADIFPLIRNEVIKWGGQTMALPLGVDPHTIEPQTAERGALRLLKAAAPQAVTKDRIGVLFDVETMKPRITEQPFIDALNSLSDVPLPNREGPGEGSTAVQPPIPILGYNDRLIAVTSSSRNAASAFKLIEWLALPDVSTQFARIGAGVLPVRISTSTSPAWYSADITADDRSNLAKQLSAELGGEQAFIIPRIPGIDEYLAALDDAVKSATVDKTPADETLLKAAQRWEQITDARGRDAQRDAYQKHLGITK